MDSDESAFDWAHGHYFPVFKGFHVLLVAALFLLYTRAARARTRADWAAFTFSILVLAGHHTLVGNLREAYPANHYLEMAVFAMGAFVLSQSRGGWWIDVTAVVVFVAAALTIESGRR